MKGSSALSMLNHWLLDRSCAPSPKHSGPFTKSLLRSWLAEKMKGPGEVKGSEGGGLLVEWIEKIVGSSLSSEPLDSRAAVVRALDVACVLGEKDEGMRRDRRVIGEIVAEKEKENKKEKEILQSEEEMKEVWERVELECVFVAMRLLEDDDEDVRLDMAAALSSLFSSSLPLSSPSASPSVSIPLYTLGKLWEKGEKDYGNPSLFFNHIRRILFESEEREREREIMEIDWHKSGDLFDIEPDNLWHEPLLSMQFAARSFFDSAKKSFFSNGVLSPRGHETFTDLFALSLRDINDAVNWIGSLHDRDDMGHFLPSVHQDPSVLLILYRRILSSLVLVSFVGQLEEGEREPLKKEYEEYREKIKRQCHLLVQKTKPKCFEEICGEGEAKEGRLGTLLHPTVFNLISLILDPSALLPLSCAIDLVPH
eukprot:CAMPEP_0201484014 /NCGR_PEP_ID=MMETSP0151_2-20130828/8207_1 /ASSEMBLY_ACC=CAM_ASM_000257 /TAXON_ID=200890 /ORGANISM="Paramoeba atlantica, Strain 621/1 / CCAP 1560/9" /LENGTH=424 /DNA_ID=CAMNT_0047867453 /DNA_START=822 /DNA_END=2096 /DNA_ORIENTATION=+